MEAAPTDVAKSAAICGSSESVTRTMAWLANPAPASRAMERVGTFCICGSPDERAARVRRAVARYPGFVPHVAIARQRCALWLMRATPCTLPRNRRNETIMIDKTYQPSAIEGRIYARWEEAGTFRCARPERIAAKPYCIVIPPPNVTGSLHMGHALNNTLQDVLVRFERMRGRDVLWQPGTDHAGIATQMV